MSLIGRHVLLALLSLALLVVDCWGRFGWSTGRIDAPVRLQSLESEVSRPKRSVALVRRFRARWG